jgi:hypothetical protein
LGRGRGRGAAGGGSSRPLRLIGLPLTGVIRAARGKMLLCPPPWIARCCRCCCRPALGAFLALGLARLRCGFRPGGRAFRRGVTGWLRRTGSGRLGAPAPLTGVGLLGGNQPLAAIGRPGVASGLGGRLHIAITCRTRSDSRLGGRPPLADAG